MAALESGTDVHDDDASSDHVPKVECTYGHESYSVASPLETLASRGPAAIKGPVASSPPLPTVEGAFASLGRPSFQAGASPGSDAVDSTVGPVFFPNHTFPATPSAVHRHLDRPMASQCTPPMTSQSDGSPDWTLDSVAARLSGFAQDVKDGHAELTTCILESVTVVDRRVHRGKDLFAGLKLEPASPTKGETMRIKSKQHLRARKDSKEEHYDIVCTKTNKDRVPRYRFHQVAIKKNILTPNTMLTFVPHLRDLETSEESKYNIWLEELEDIDLKSGFKPMNREAKQALTYHLERAATMSLYLDAWLRALAIPACNKSALISYMASCEPDDAITPQQKTSILRSHHTSDNATPETNRAAQLFTNAFRLVFTDRLPVEKQVDLRKVLLLDESVDGIMDSKPTAKDGAATQTDVDDAAMNEYELAESNLATYCILGCLICFSHSCDHGEYDNKNLKRTFSISSCSHLSDALRRRRRRLGPDHRDAQASLAACQRHCHRLGGAPCTCTRNRDWSEDERVLLRCMHATAVHRDPICLAADFLDRCCHHVLREALSLQIVVDSSEPTSAEPARAKKSLSWYDRRKKVLIGDWQDHTVSHQHQRRETLEPCSHEGPCRPRACSCVDAGLLCEKFCSCTVDDCEYKFTGCACHASGKTCQPRQKDKPCICVQLNRECDPQLCGSCGALERADPVHATDEPLHATGCQNCDLQRGAGKSLVLGQSQLEGCGYGLFTAEDIAQDDFIIEYVGELITHDEGVRREARRGDVFDEQSNISYVFTLLENEGIWVDAAIYGNLSRYINHASENDRWGCNITPRILHVNGEYRIKFTAMRDIRAGEELFFNYGENFPNLTKKLLDHKAGTHARVAKVKGVRSRGMEPGDQVARKAPKQEKRRGPGRPRVRKADEVGPNFDSVEAPNKSRKRKRQAPTGRAEEGHGMPAPVPTPATDSAPERRHPDAGSLTRLRQRARGLSVVDGPDAESPTKAMVKPKKGKRGGARPGSGRPRKHPRPVPKPAQVPEVAPQEVAEPATAEAATLLGRKTLGADGTRFDDVMEVADSDDAPSWDPRQIPTPHEVGGGGGQEPAEEEDEDQDVVIRKRDERNVRSRRPPAKFREDDTIWS
ncbi:hypothetical protein RJ55_08398 [Drechmeria coniospora]|nr:hypothetical protein RJ55_08398 [Drechmeria coniospora]